MTSMVVTAAAVTSAILGTITLAPGSGAGTGGEGDSVYMASTGTDVLHGISDGEPLPFVVPPQPYEAEAARQLAGPELLDLTSLLPQASDLPDPLLTTPGSKVIPPRVLAAYQAAAAAMNKEKPSCHMSWPLIAGIGRIESDHARNGDVDAKGNLLRPIVGPALNGEGNFALIRDSDGGKLDGDTVFDRAVGPMQFLPGTWAGLGRDGNGDGKKDPSNVADAALATAGYLCLGGGDMLNRDQLLAAVFRYNRSWEYVSHVLAWAGVYASKPDKGVPVPGKKPNKPGKGGPTTAPTTPVVTPTPVPTTPVTDPVTVPTPDPTTDPTTTPEPSPEPTTTPEPKVATIGGRVFKDLDGNTADNPDDPGVAEVPIRIFGTATDGSAVDLTVITDATGQFALPGVAPGTYSVSLGVLPGGLLPFGALVPAGWAPGLTTLGSVEVVAGSALAVAFIVG